MRQARKLGRDSAWAKCVSWLSAVEGVEDAKGRGQSTFIAFRPFSFEKASFELFVESSNTAGQRGLDAKGWATR